MTEMIVAIAILLLVFTTGFFGLFHSGRRLGSAGRPGSSGRLGRNGGSDLAVRRHEPEMTPPADRAGLGRIWVAGQEPPESR
jgi:hypothetical protein